MTTTISDPNVLTMHRSTTDELRKNADMLACYQRNLPVKNHPACALDPVTSARVARYEIEVEMVWAISVDLSLVAPWFTKLHPEDRLLIGQRLRDVALDLNLTTFRYSVDGTAIYTTSVETQDAIHAIDFGFYSRKIATKAKQPSILILKATSSATPSSSQSIYSNAAS